MEEPEWRSFFSCEPQHSDQYVNMSTEKTIRWAKDTQRIPNIFFVPVIMHVRYFSFFKQHNISTPKTQFINIIDITEHCCGKNTFSCFCNTQTLIPTHNLINQLIHYWWFLLALTNSVHATSQVVYVLEVKPQDSVLMVIFVIININRTTHIFFLLTCVCAYYGP